MQRLQQGIGSMLASRPLGSGGQLGGSQMGGGQFGQVGGGSGPTPLSLEEVLAKRGFTVPERPTGMQNAMQSLFKDPVTGENRTGGQHAANHANAMSKFYGQNPEALEIAKQYNTDPTQFGGKPAPTRSLQQPIEMIQRPGGSALLSPSQIEAGLERHRRQQPQPVQRDTMARESRIPQPQPVQEFQPIQRPSFQSLQQPMGQQQPQFTQQDMGGMMRLMMQMFQQMMQGGMGQQSYNSGAFSQAPSSYYPQYPQPPQRSFAPPPMQYPAPPRYQAPRPQPYRTRQTSSFSGSPFGRY